MKKNKIYQIALLTTLPSLLFTACRFEDEDFFDESASLRIEHAIDDVQEILVKPENGWVMQYFTGTGVAHFEGFNLFARFEKSMKVTLAGDHRYLRDGNAGKYTEDSSLYSLLLEDGPVLALNTWNDVLSPFVDPVSPWTAPSTLVKDGAGMEGDNNFVIVSYKDDEVILRGERYGAAVRLTACDRPWKDYISACDAMKKKITNSTLISYYITDGTDTLYLTGISKGRVRMSERLSDPLVNDSLSCVFTPNGIRFEKTDTIGSKTFQEFTISADESKLENEEKAVSIIPCWDAYMVEHTSVWEMDQTLFTAEQTELFNKINDDLKKFNANYTLQSIGIGKTTSSIYGLVLTFYTNAAKSKTNTAGISMSSTRIGYGQVEFKNAEEESYDKNMSTIMEKATDIVELCNQFIAILNGKYNVTPDSYFQPTGGTFVAIDGGTNFKLYLQ